MVAAPAEPPQLSVASDGSLAAHHEAGRISLLELPVGAVFAEIAVDPDAAASEIAWVGSPPRLLVLSRYAAHSTVHMLDPTGPRSIAEIRLELPMRLAAAVGNSALVIGQLGAAVLATSDSHVHVYPFSTRSVPLAAGAAGSQFVVGLGGAIEEWDPQSRLPKRRLRLPRAAAITAVGGSDRVVWMTTQQEPARLDVIPLLNRGQPKAHDLPEPIARIASHPRSDLIACLGAETRRLYLVDLDGRHRPRIVGPDELADDGAPIGAGGRFDAIGMLVGRHSGVLVMQAGRTAVIVPHVASREASDPALTMPTTILPRAEPIVRSEPVPRLPISDPALRIPPPVPATEGDGARDANRASGEARDADAFAGVSLHDAEPNLPPMSPASAVSPPSVSALFRHVAPVAAPAGIPIPAPARPNIATPPAGVPVAAAARAPSSASERFSAWRDQVRDHHHQHPAPSAPLDQTDPPPVHGELRLSWRDEIVAWSRAVVAGALEHDSPPAPRIDALVARFDLAPQLQPAIVLLYGAHLCGERGAAPIDVARVLDRQWDEALGRGELARRGIAIHTDSRVLLAPTLLRVLDELPPLLGPLLGDPDATSPPVGPCIVVAPPGESLLAIAARCLHVATSILVAHGDPDLTELAFEARAHGAIPLLRHADPPPEPMIFVVDDEATAAASGLPRLS